MAPLPPRQPVDWVSRGRLVDLNGDDPVPGSAVEIAAFARVQAGLPALFRRIADDPAAPRTVVVVPGLSMDQAALARVAGVRHYEERHLAMLMWLRLPATRIVYLTSEPPDPVIVDYYLNLLSGVPACHARSRLVLLSAYDASNASLTRKILERPRLLARLRAAIGDPSQAHLSCFAATALERTLAVRLGVPLYACDPALADLGSKSGSREVFRAAGVALRDGAERLRDAQDLAQAIVALKAHRPELRRVVVKHNHGFSGEGNAVLDLPQGTVDTAAVAISLRRDLRCEAPGETIDRYLDGFAAGEGIVESWVDGVDKRSPSVQLRINPLGGLELISTHDQVLGGPTGQIFLGSTFPADPEYRGSLQAAGLRIGELLRARGVLGRFAVDFVSVREGAAWRHVAIEINLRNGGTTLPYQMLQFLTAGACDGDAEFRTAVGAVRSYHATDNLVRAAYRRLIPEDLIDILVRHRLHFDPTCQQGVVFNLIGALSEFGKLGLVCIADTPHSARALCARTVAVLDAEAGADRAAPATPAIRRAPEVGGRNRASRRAQRLRGITDHASCRLSAACRGVPSRPRQSRTRAGTRAGEPRAAP